MNEELCGRITALESKIDILIPEIQKNNEQLTKIITGNGTPERGLAFRIAQMEGKEESKKQNSMALWTFISSLGVIVIGDIINRFFHHK